MNFEGQTFAESYTTGFQTKSNGKTATAALFIKTIHSIENEYAIEARENSKLTLLLF